MTARLDADAIRQALAVPLTWHPRTAAERESFDAVFTVWTRLPALLTHVHALEQAHATDVALRDHDLTCRDYACLMRGGCPERAQLVVAHDAARAVVLEGAAGNEQTDAGGSVPEPVVPS